MVFYTKIFERFSVLTHSHTEVTAVLNFLARLVVERRWRLCPGLGGWWLIHSLRNRESDRTVTGDSFDRVEHGITLEATGQISSQNILVMACIK